MMLTPSLNSFLRSVGRRVFGSLTFRTKVRGIEAAGFGILLVGLYLVWAPLGFIALGVVTIIIAQLIRGE